MLRQFSFYIPNDIKQFFFPHANNVNLQCSSLLQLWLSLEKIPVVYRGLVIVSLRTPSFFFNQGFSYCNGAMVSNRKHGVNTNLLLSGQIGAI